MNTYAIRTEFLSRRFGAIQAVDKLSFEVPAGTVFGFLGPNGAGKTTTIRLLLGLIELSAGHAEVLGFLYSGYITTALQGGSAWHGYSFDGKWKSGL